MDLDQKFQKAKISLMRFEPWLGQLSCYITFKEIKNQKDSIHSLDTAAINEDGELFYNKEWVEKLNDQQMNMLLMHEIMHLVYQHIFRSYSRNQIIWNMAADLKINTDLSDFSHFQHINGLITADSLKKMNIKIENIHDKTTEMLYSELDQKFPYISVKIGKNGVPEVEGKNLSQTQKKEISDMIKDLLPNSRKSSKSELDRKNREWLNRFNLAVQSSKNRGSIPLGLKRELDSLENPELSWSSILRQRFLRSIYKKNWKRINKKWLPNYFPGKIKNRSLKAVCAIDTSGSMEDADIKKAVTEIYGLANSFKSFKLYIVFNDAKVWSWTPVTDKNKNRLKALEAKGGGGTDFRPVFEQIQKELKNRIDSLIFFTDLDGEFPDNKPSYQTYWITRNFDDQVPFGIKIKLKN